MLGKLFAQEMRALVKPAAIMLNQHHIGMLAYNSDFNSFFTMI